MSFLKIGNLVFILRPIPTISLAHLNGIRHRQDVGSSIWMPFVCETRLCENHFTFFCGWAAARSLGVGHWYAFYMFLFCLVSVGSFHIYPLFRFIPIRLSLIGLMHYMLCCVAVGVSRHVKLSAIKPNTVQMSWNQPIRSLSSITGYTTLWNLDGKAQVTIYCLSSCLYALNQLKSRQSVLTPIRASVSIEPTTDWATLVPTLGMR